MQIDDALDGLQGPDHPPEVGSAQVEPPEMPPFVPAPGLIGINTRISYPTQIGAELYWSGSSSLPIKFNGEEVNLSVFTDALMDQTVERCRDNP